MAILIETDTGTVDLSSSTAGGVFGSFTVPRSGLYTADIRLTALQNDNDSIVLRLLRYASDGTTLISKGAISSFAKGNPDGTTSTVFGNTLGSNQMMYCATGEILKCHALNATSESATVSFTVNWLDINGISETALLTLGRMYKGYFNTYRYVATNGNDGNTGLDPAAPKLTARAALDLSAAGDAVIVGPGTFATLSTDNTRLTIPDGVSVFGAGMDATVITGTQSGLTMGPILAFLGRGLAQDMTIDGSASGNTVAAGASNAGTDTLTAGMYIECRRLRLRGRTDGFLINTGAASNVMRARLYDCDINCLYDAFAVGGDAHDVYAERCFIEAVGPSSTNRACGVNLQTGSPRVTLRNCTIRASGSNGTTTGNGNYGVQLLVTGTAGVARLDNCNIHAETHTLESFDVDNLLTGGTVILSGTTFRTYRGGGIIRKPHLFNAGWWPSGG
jgi:hypothetical protein